ncbi:MAG TPA: hypothetical protein V6D19_05425 [Stenomitos sp.]
MFNADDSELKAQQEQIGFDEFVNGQTDGRTFVFDVKRMHDVDYVSGFICGLNAWRNELVRQEVIMSVSDDCPF